MPVVMLARVIFVAMVATIGDYVWFEFGVRHTPVHGAIHGAVLLLAVGLVLGQAAGAMARGGLGGIAAGLFGALAFYVVAGPLGYLSALLVAWILTWLVMAGVTAWLRRDVVHVGRWLVPGLVAAIGSGGTFYLVSGIWTDHPDGPRNYLWHLVAWIVAWGPGILTLTWSSASETES